MNAEIRRAVQEALADDPSLNNKELMELLKPAYPGVSVLTISGCRPRKSTLRKAQDADDEDELLPTRRHGTHDISRLSQNEMWAERVLLATEVLTLIDCDMATNGHSQAPLRHSVCNALKYLDKVRMTLAAEAGAEAAVYDTIPSRVQGLLRHYQQHKDA